MRRFAVLRPTPALPGAAPWLGASLRERASARVPALVRAEPALFALVAVTAVAYATFSVLRHMHYGSFAYDLGIFDQAFWQYAHFQEPRTTIVGLPTILGDHFHPILLLLVPLYWIWDDPRVLLIAQGILVAASIVPIWLIVRDRLGRPPAYLFAVAYTLFWAVHSAIVFDFHEISFAPLLIALVIRAIDKREWRRYFVLIGILLLVKENMGLLVAAFGVYLLFHRAWRPAAATFVAGLAWYALATKIFIPFFAGGYPYRHWSYDQFGPDLPHAVATMVRDPGLVLRVLVNPHVKVETMLYLFVPFLALTLLSPMAVLCLPLIAERMLSTNFNFWNTGAHYSLTIAPIIVLGAADGLRRLIRLLRVEHRRVAVATAVGAVIAAGNLYIAGQFPLRALFHPSYYRLTAEDRATSEGLALIPPSASVTAESRYVPHLTHRRDIFLMAPGAPDAQYLVANGADYYRISYPHAGYVDEQFFILANAQSYWPIYDRGGLVILQRRPHAPRTRGGTPSRAGSG